ncbi:MAG: hypothetical protein AAB536_03600 [Patescibacteria group bacterium]
MNALEELDRRPCAVEYDPNCHSARRYVVRLPAKGTENVDMKPENKTHDIVGHGLSIEQAAENALTKAGLFRRARPPRQLF